MQFLINNTNSDLWKIGCGTIAMCDAELYMTLQNSDYSLRFNDIFDEDFQKTRLVEMDDYKDYVEQMYKFKYPIFDVYHGLYPTNMEGGLVYYFMSNHCYNKTVKWARYGQLAGDAAKQKIADEIERMLNEDIPVVFSYHTFEEGDGIIMYDSLENAEKGIINSYTEEQDSHYMTIIGLYRCPGEQPWNYKYYLKVVSWGNVYYIDFDMYAKKLNWFSNIMSVY